MSVSVSVVCCQVEVTVSGWSFIQKGHTKCCVSECDRDASIMRRPWLTRGLCNGGVGGEIGQRSVVHFISQALYYHRKNPGTK